MDVGGSSITPTSPYGRRESLCLKDNTKLGTPKTPASRTPKRVTIVGRDSSQTSISHFFTPTANPFADACQQGSSTTTPVARELLPC